MRPPAGGANAATAVPDVTDPLAALRIAVFSDAIPGRNGVGTYYDDLARHLEDHVDRIVMVTPPRGGTGRALLRSIPMPGDPTQRLYWPPLRRIWREMQALSPHVVVAATPGAYGSMAMLVSMRMGAGFCVGYHTQVDQLAGLYWERSLGAVLRRILGAWDRVMFRRAESVLVLNEALLEKVSRGGVRNARLVGTPIPKLFLSEPLAPPSRTVRTVSFVGRLAPEKRLDQIVEAARACPGIRFRVAGDGPLRGEVEGWARACPNVEALGWVDRTQVLRILDDSDLLVLPSRYETFGSIALEAMARRRLAVVSPYCGISRWSDLAQGMVLMGDGERLVETLDRVRAMEGTEREALAKRGRLAAERLSERTISEWLKVCAGAAGAGVP